MKMFGRYIKNLNKEVGNTLTSEKAKRVRHTLITIGVILIIVGIISFIFGVVKMFNGIFDSPDSGSCPEIGEPGWFDCEKDSNSNQFAHKAGSMILGFGVGAVGVILGVIGVAMVNAGLAVLITGEGSKMIDNAIERAEEEERYHNPKESKSCANCGGKLEFIKGKWKCPYCGDKL